MKFKFIVIVPSELSAGLRGFTEEVMIESDGKYDQETLTEAREYFRQAIAEWFDVSVKQVPTIEEYQESVGRF